MITRNTDFGVRLMLALPLVWAALEGCAAAAAVMGMKIDSVEGDGRTTDYAVTTTGTKFVFDKARNTIAAYQRIPEWRQVATISSTIASFLGGLTLQSSDDQESILSASDKSFTVGADGLLRMSFAARTDVTIRGNYTPAYQGQDGKSLFLPDAAGGVGMYPIGGSFLTQKPTSWNPGWAVKYTAHSNTQLWVPVFPPRPFDAKQSQETMLHSLSNTHPYPSDKELVAWRNTGSVLTLHSWIWQGNQGSTYGVEQDQSWGTSVFVPKDAQELHRVVRTAHQLGMKVIPYMSPFYFGNPNGNIGKGTMPQFLDKVQSVLSEYGFDGVYFDGVYRNDVQGTYELVRQTRQIIGDGGILYVHSTGQPLAVIPVPFIDTYATYTIQGEHGQLTDDFARWFVSGYNLGNSIGTFCYDTTRPSSQMIGLVLTDNARLPYWVGDGTWNGVSYHLSDSEIALFSAEYFPKLDPLDAPEPASSAAAAAGVPAYGWRTHIRLGCRRQHFLRHGHGKAAR